MPKNDNSDIFKNTVAFILRKYNSAVSAGKDIQSAFDAVKEIANKKGAPYYSVFGEIGKALTRNELPSMLQIKQASEYCKLSGESVLVKSS